MNALVPRDPCRIRTRTFSFETHSRDATVRKKSWNFPRWKNLLLARVSIQLNGPGTGRENDPRVARTERKVQRNGQADARVRARRTKRALRFARSFDRRTIRTPNATTLGTAHRSKLLSRASTLRSLVFFESTKRLPVRAVG